MTDMKRTLVTEYINDANEASVIGGGYIMNSKLYFYNGTDLVGGYDVLDSGSSGGSGGGGGSGGSGGGGGGGSGGGSTYGDIALRLNFDTFEKVSITTPDNAVLWGDITFGSYTKLKTNTMLNSMISNGIDGTACLSSTLSSTLFSPYGEPSDSIPPMVIQKSITTSANASLFGSATASSKSVGMTNKTKAMFLRYPSPGDMVANHMTGGSGGSFNFPIGYNADSITINTPANAITSTINLTSTVLLSSNASDNGINDKGVVVGSTTNVTNLQSSWHPTVKCTSFTISVPELSSENYTSLITPVSGDSAMSNKENDRIIVAYGVHQYYGSGGITSDSAADSILQYISASTPASAIEVDNGHHVSMNGESSTSNGVGGRGMILAYGMNIFTLSIDNPANSVSITDKYTTANSTQHYAAATSNA